MKGSDRKYHINGMVFEILTGSRAQVHHGTAYKTTGGLKKKDIKKNKHGKIVSRAKSAKGAQMLKRLTNKGYFTKKGKFGFVRRDGKNAKTRKRSKSRKHAIRGVKWEDRTNKSGRFTKKPGYKRKRSKKRR